MLIRNRTRATVVVRRAWKGVSAWQRLVGLLPKSALAPDEGLWMIPCNAIHTFGMRFTIDAIFLDRSLNVVGLMEGVRPFRVGKLFRSAYSVLEVSSGVIAESKTRVGDKLEAEDEISSNPISGMDENGGGQAF